MVNENVIGPTINPMKALYWKQFGGGPTKADMKRMDPTSTIIPE
jgi:arylsulfatase